MYNSLRNTQDRFFRTYFIFISNLFNMFSIIIPTKKSKSIYNVLSQMFVYIRTMGLLQFSANLNEIPAHQIYLTHMDWFMFGVQLTCVVIFTILSMTLANYGQGSMISMLHLGSRILMRCGMVSNCVFLIINLFNRQRIWSIFQRMDEFDVEVILKAKITFIVIDVWKWKFSKLNDWTEFSQVLISTK